MKVIKQSREYSKKEAYQIMHNKHLSLKDVPTDTEFELQDYIVYEDEKGTSVMVMFVESDNGQLTISTTSPSAIRDLTEAADFFEAGILNLALRRSQSKAGRTFMTLEVI